MLVFIKPNKMDILNLLGLDYLKVEYRYERTSEHAKVLSEFRHSVEQYCETAQDYRNRQSGLVSSSCTLNPLRFHSEVQ